HLYHSIALFYYYIFRNSLTNETINSRKSGFAKAKPLFYDIELETGFNSFSEPATTTAADASPTIFVAVLIISNTRSIPAISAIPSSGILTEVKTIASMTIPAPGTPAVPIEASTVVNTTVNNCKNVNSKS